MPFVWNNFPETPARESASRRSYISDNACFLPPPQDQIALHVALLVCFDWNFNQISLHFPYRPIVKFLPNWKSLPGRWWHIDNALCPLFIAPKWPLTVMGVVVCLSVLYWCLCFADSSTWVNMVCKSQSVSFSKWPKFIWRWTKVKPTGNEIKENQKTEQNWTLING